MSWHVQPAADIYVNRDTAVVGFDPSVADTAADQQERETVLSSKVGVDATRKHQYPMLSVPPQVDMDRIDAHCSEYGLD